MGLHIKASPGFGPLANSPVDPGRNGLGRCIPTSAPLNRKHWNRQALSVARLPETIRILEAQ